MAPRSGKTAQTRPGNRPRQPDQARTRTVGDWLKLVATGVLGTVLLVRGLRRRSLRGAVMALVGGWLLVRTVRGTARSREMHRPRSATGRGGNRTGTADRATVSRSITVGKPADELYEIWRDPDQFSQIVGHFADVRPSGGDRLRWTVDGPRGRELSWETRIVEAEPGEILRWETTGDAPVTNEGTVRFRPAPGDRGTEVTLSVSLYPPGGTLGTMALDRLDVVPKAAVGRALGRFKSLAETGEIPTLEGNPSARGRGDLL